MQGRGVGCHHESSSDISQGQTPYIQPSPHAENRRAQPTQGNGQEDDDVARHCQPGSPCGDLWQARNPTPWSTSISTSVAKLKLKPQVEPGAGLERHWLSGRTATWFSQCVRARAHTGSLRGTAQRRGVRGVQSAMQSWRRSYRSGEGRDRGRQRLSAAHQIRTAPRLRSQTGTRPWQRCARRKQ